MLEQGTSFAKMSLAWSSATNAFIESTGPEIVQESGPLWQAISMSGGHIDLICKRID